MKLHKRVEGLEKRLSPAAPVKVHLIGVEVGESKEGARARYGPICESDHIFFLVPMEARHEAA